MNRHKKAQRAQNHFSLLCLLRFFVASLALLTSPFSLFALEPWQEVLAKMPLKPGVSQLSKTNAVEVMLEAFRENSAAKALIFMPGATDEFYFFHRGNATLTNNSPTLLDAITALTNQTLIHVTFRERFILLHSSEDPLEPLFKIEDEKTFERIQKKKFAPHIIYNDRDWDFILPTLTFRLDTKILPEKRSHDSHHFYRHNLAAHNLNGFEALQALAFAGKTQFTIQKKKILFEGDKRFRARPVVPKDFAPVQELTR